MGGMTRFTSLVAALALALPAVAAADAVPPPPMNCPTGARPLDFCHGPQTCRIADCTDNADCNAGEECVERALCVREHCCGGFSCTIDGATPPRYTHVDGPCGAGGGCEGFGATCETSRVCVPITGSDAGPPLTDGGGTDGGGVDGGGTDGGGTDGGGADMDAGDSDSGPSGGMDAGPDGPTDGGCCSVVGHGHPYGGAVALVLVALVGLRLRRKR